MAKTKRMLFLCVISFSILLGSCNPVDTPTVFPISQIQARAYGVPLFSDDFEDSELDWEADRYYHEDSYKDIDPEIGSYPDVGFLLLEGPQPYRLGHYAGLRKNLSIDNLGIKPTYIRFEVFSYVIEGNISAFLIMQGKYTAGPPIFREAIEFRYDDQGIILVNDQVGPKAARNGPWTDYWHLIELKNIDWNLQSGYHLPIFSLYIDGNLISHCVKFTYPVESLEWISVYNMDFAITGYDNIVMTEDWDPDLEGMCEDPPPLPPPPLPAPLDSQGGSPDTFIATAKQDAACRQGPANEYPEEDFVEVGFSAPVIGRNAESTWLVVTGPNWEEDCWIWKGVLETTGNINPVPILPDPPLVLPDGGSPGEGGSSGEQGPSGCLVLQMAGGTKCISPCPPGANPGTPCTP